VDTIEPRCRDPFRCGIGISIYSPRQNYVVSRAPSGDHIQNQLRRVLEVDIDRHDDASASNLESGRQCRFLAEVTAQVDDPDPWFVDLMANQLFQRVIDTAVIYEDKFDLERRVPRKHRPGAVQE